MIKHGLALILSLLLTMTAQSATYADMFDPKVHITVSEHRAQITDVEVEARPCAKEEPFVCVRSSVFNFGVSKDNKKNEWDFEGDHYRVTGHDGGRIFGEIAQYRIIAVTGKADFLVAYSDSRGLLAIKSSAGNVLVISELCGIARLKLTGICEAR